MTWKELPGWPRKCHDCGGRVVMREGASFAARVVAGKVVAKTSKCYECLNGRSPSEARGTHNPKCLCSECTKARSAKAATA